MLRDVSVQAPPRTRRTGSLSVFCLALGLIATAAGCAGRSPFDLTGQLEYDPSLLTGERVFDVPLTPDELPAAAINTPSQAMLDYVARTVRPQHLSSIRFQDLFDGLTEDGYFEAAYAANRTLTAAETFEGRKGNCLSFTNMFVALSRAAGLDARYQIVDVPATWDADSGFLIRYTHINVVLKNVRLDSNLSEEVTVDFNLVLPDEAYPRRVVSDEYAESLFYANQSVSLLREGSHREAFAYIRRAIEVAPANVDLWVNLGALYAVLGDYASSIEAYEVALQLEPRHKAAFSGLARSYANDGDFEMAAVYEEKVRHYRQRNPYYHYALAQAAYEQADFPTALDYVNAAIDIKKRVARFHLLKGLVEYRLGEAEASRESLRRAQRYGLHRSVKLDLLRSLASGSGVASS